ncbi:MAG TPA: hypothetical protein VHT29_11730 [Solirubrobacteraceae bacterium]|jgi:hypothetical protein|nr:hypothetical protein [Solirubrobacteraceae bacterium]
MPAPAPKHLLTLLCVPLSAVSLAACGSAVSTSSFSGAKHEVAQAISNLQADATAAEQKKLCADDLAAPVVTRLGGQKGCETAVKNQLAEVDSLEVSVQSVQIAPGGASAIAHVKSEQSGKSKPGTVSLVKEGKAWKVSAAS